MARANYIDALGNTVTVRQRLGRGRTLRQLIKELHSFEDQDLLVEISVDGGDTHKPISLVKKSGQACLFVNTPEYPSTWLSRHALPPAGP